MTAVSDTVKFRTSDMVLATLLHMDGHEYCHELERTRKGVPFCTWVFDTPADDREFEQLVLRFEAGKCKVEPREFANNWANVRRAMFSFLHPDGRS